MPPPPLPPDKSIKERVVRKILCQSKRERPKMRPIFQHNIILALESGFSANQLSQGINTSSQQFHP
jgi:hypothetical protein